MFLPWIFSIGVMQMVQAQLDPETQLPQCAKICIETVLGEAACPFQEVRSCFCANGTLQTNLAICVLPACNVEEQYVTNKHFQNAVCAGVSQESRLWEIQRVIIIAAPVAYLLVILRFISRWRIAHKFWWDDWIILLAAVSMIPSVVSPFIPTTQGAGLHFWVIPPERIVPIRQIFYVAQMLYCVVLTASKLSILFLYLRIFIDDTFRLITNVSIILIFAHGIAFLLTIIFQCIPISSNWTLEPARCVNYGAVVFSGAVLSIVEDFYIMLLPIWELRKLSFSMRKKVALAFMFALGSFACITSIVRLQFLLKSTESIDLTWNTVDIQIWSNLEMLTGVMCACILCVRPLVLKAIPDCLRISNVFGAFKLPPQVWSPSNGRSSQNSEHQKPSERNNEHAAKNTIGGGRVEGFGEQEDENKVQAWYSTTEANTSHGGIEMDHLNTSQDQLTPRVTPSPNDISPEKTRGHSYGKDPER